MFNMSVTSDPVLTSNPIDNDIVHDKIVIMLLWLIS